MSVWLVRLGVQVSHSRPYHPQTQGKDERFHRTLQAEVLQYQQFRDIARCQQAFDAWRQVYNYERPHQASSFAVLASRYQPSPRTFPESLRPIEYSPEDQVRKVQDKGQVSFQGQLFQVSKAFRGYPLALRATRTDGVWDVCFCQQRLG